jgi:hypothetical protein
MSVRLRDRAAALAQLRGPGEWLLLVKVCAFAAAVPALMRLPLPRVQRLIVRPVRARPAAGPREIDRFERVVTLAPRIAMPVVKPGCLTRGVTLFWFLRRAGFPVALQFGVDAASAGPTDGHCWLVLDGEPICEKRDPRLRFTDTLRLPQLAA